MGSSSRNAWSALFAALGILSALVTIFSTRWFLSPIFMGLAVLGIVLCTGWVLWTILRKPPEGVPSDEFLDRHIAACKVCPASREDVAWAADLAQRIYRGSDRIPKDLMLEWFDKNPTGFFIIFSTSGERVGNLDILPLKPTTLNRFVRGEITEGNITGDCLYSPAESNEIQHLYIESFVSIIEKSPGKFRTNAIAASHVLSRFDSLVAKICDPRQLKKLYAIAASKNGKRLLSRLSFQVSGAEANRLDHHDLFEGEFKSVARLLCKFFGDETRHAAIVELISSAGADEVGL